MGVLSCRVILLDNVICRLRQSWQAWLCARCCSRFGTCCYSDSVKVAFAPQTVKTHVQHLDRFWSCEHRSSKNTWSSCSRDNAVWPFPPPPFLFPSSSLVGFSVLMDFSPRQEIGLNYGAHHKSCCIHGVGAFRLDCIICQSCNILKPANSYC